MSYSQINYFQEIICLVRAGRSQEAICTAEEAIKHLSTDVIDPDHAFHVLRIAQLEKALSQALQYIGKGLEIGGFDNGSVSEKRVFEELNRVLKCK
jgi:hypothetical protein